MFVLITSNIRWNIRQDHNHILKLVHYYSNKIIKVFLSIFPELPILILLTTISAAE